jgi:hypothetical protein
MSATFNLCRGGVFFAALTVLGGFMPTDAQPENKPYAGIPPEAWSVFAEVRAKPGKADELRRVTLPLIALVRSDPKNLVYFCRRTGDRPVI